MRLHPVYNFLVEYCDGFIPVFIIHWVDTACFPLCAAQICSSPIVSHLTSADEDETSQTHCQWSTAAGAIFAGYIQSGDSFRLTKSEKSSQKPLS